jgi:hypothetical protein
MKLIYRRVRGALGLGLTWAAAWGLLGGGLSAAMLAALRGELPFGIGWRIFLSGVVQWSVLGFVTGVAFSALLSLKESRREDSAQSMGRIAGWGALGGIVPPTLVLALAAGAGWVVPTTAALVLIGTGAVLGSSSAALSLKLARRGTSEYLGRPVRSGEIDEHLAATSRLPDRAVGVDGPSSVEPL